MVYSLAFYFVFLHHLSMKATMDAMDMDMCL